VRAGRVPMTISRMTMLMMVNRGGMRSLIRLVLPLCSPLPIPSRLFLPRTRVPNTGSRTQGRTRVLCRTRTFTRSRNPTVQNTGCRALQHMRFTHRTAASLTVLQTRPLVINIDPIITTLLDVRHITVHIRLRMRMRTSRRRRRRARMMLLQHRGGGQRTRRRGRRGRGERRR
jgi:hypothetical protein